MMRFLSISLLLSFLLVGSAAADGWPQQRGHGYYKIGYRFVQATEFYDFGGTLMNIPTLGDHTISFYGEYGVTNRITVVAYVPFLERITLNKQVGETTGFVFFEGDEVTGIADPEVGFRVGLLNLGSAVVSGSVIFGVPIGNDTQPNGLLTGDGEFNQRVKLEAGYSFWPIPAYALATVGFNNRTQGFSDEAVYSAEAGYTIKNRVTLIARMRGLESLENGADDVTGGMGGLYANNQRYLSYGAEVIVGVAGPLGVSFGVDGGTRLRNSLSAPAFSFGIFAAL